MSKENQVIESVYTEPDNINESSTKKVQMDEQDKKHFVYNAEQRRQRLEGGVTTRDFLMILSAGFALISDGYQNNVMSMLNKYFAIKYPKVYDANMSAQVSNASLVGTILGQLTMGFFADRISRKAAIVLSTFVLVIGSIMCAASHGKTVTGMFWMLTISRGVVGWSVGGEYPSSSLTASEAANESVKKRGGVFIMVTNFPLSFGGPLSICVFLIVYQITGMKSGLWRSLFVVGMFLPLSVFYFRMKMVTSVLFKKSAMRKNPPYWLALKYYWPRLLGTTITWFLYDFVTFPNGIFSATIISNVISDAKDLQSIAEWTLLLGAIALPGVFVGALIVDRIGKKYTMMIGFVGYIVFGLVVGCAYFKIKNITALFIVLYGLMQSFGNLGMGNCLGLVSSESFATPVRGTFYGFSAVIGKVGAVCGTYAFKRVLFVGGTKDSGQRYTFIIAACCGVVGVILTYILIPNLKVDDLLEEDVKFKNYLRDSGYKGHFGLEENDDEEDIETSETDSVELEQQNFTEKH
ncbi:GIT1 [Candida pseudojiufengensis]|uniref:GIT1 n=1 Tax=Candida pseudojiufengensis TaxID=497109 RepID=UPI00222542C7|nr:GIT1 [Candida pseudojiufengensis]KAI5960070.1 GIT1 [Candida pseudojiufengensis]